MKRLIILAMFLCACAIGVQAQVVDTTVCAVLKNPKSFDGKMVRIKGTVRAGFDQFIVTGEDCGQLVDGIWLDYPAGSKAKAGPDAVLELQPAKNFNGTFTAVTRTPVKLEKDKAFKQFDSALAQTHHKGSGMCLGCVRSEVTATLVGRLDGVEDAAIKRDATGKIIGLGGFGNMNAYAARLVLQSVTDVTAKDIDYSKADALSSGETTTFKGTGELYDPLDAARKSIARLAGSPAGTQAEKDVDAFGKRGEHNGVSILYAATNEEPKDEGQNKNVSPDGVMYNCVFNLDRLEGQAQLLAILHMGQHVEDVRSPMAGNANAPLYIHEYNAWIMTASDAVASGIKLLIMPGGYIAWNGAWTPSDRVSNMDQALKEYLAKEALLNKPQ